MGKDLNFPWNYGKETYNVSSCYLFATYLQKWVSEEVEIGIRTFQR